MKKSKYYLDEIGYASYLELRLLTYLECEEKVKKVAEIIHFLVTHNFLANLKVMPCYEDVKADSFLEKQDCASLTIDVQNEKFRFKFWDGAKTYWTYHLEDLFNSMLEGRKEYDALIEKYSKITDYLFKFRDQHKDEINRITYKYYPSKEIDIEYEVQFTNNMKENQAQTDKLLKEIFDYVFHLEGDYYLDFTYTFREPCIPCQKAKEDRNESKRTTIEE